MTHLWSGIGPRRTPPNQYDSHNLLCPRTDAAAAPRSAACGPLCPKGCSPAASHGNTMCPPAAGSGQRLHCACRTAATRKQMALQPRAAARARPLHRASPPSAPRARKQGEGKNAKHRANDPYCCRFSRFLPVWVYARAFLAAKTRLKIA